MKPESPYTLCLSLPGGYPGLPNIGLEIVYEDIVNARLPSAMFRSDLLMCEYVRPSIMAKIASHDAINFFFSKQVFCDEVGRAQLNKFLHAYGISSREQKEYQMGLDHVIKKFERSMIRLKPDILAISLNSDKLIAALYFIRRAREMNPNILTVLGGSCVDGRMGESIISYFKEVDYIIRGRGEGSLGKLIQCSGRKIVPNDVPGLIRRNRDKLNTAAPHIIKGPYPQPLMYEHFKKLSLLEKKHGRDEFDLQYGIPVCASIGCWWGKCDFCGWPEHEKIYAINEPEKIARYVHDIYLRYGLKDVYWMDRIQPPRSFMNKFRGYIQKLNMHLNVVGEFHAMSCNDDYMRTMSECGWKAVQVGIESYSDELLKQMGKGTRLVHLLRFYSLCAKYGIDIQGNLLQYHPKETPADVKRNLNILRLTSHFVLPELQPYYVAEGSQLCKNFDERSHKLHVLGRYRVLYPKMIRSKLHFVYRYFPKKRDTTYLWNSIDKLLKRLSKRKIELSYVDDGTRLTIYDSRFRYVRNFTLKGLEREIIRKCTKAMSLEEICGMFGMMSKKEIKQAIGRLIDIKLLLAIDKKYVNLTMGRNK